MQPKTGREGAVTLQTIADELGVSRTTVSNAFNRPDQLTPSLQATILVTARRLGYSGPDPAAAVLRRGKSGTFAILFTESLAYALADPSALSLLQGITEATEREAIKLLLLPAPDDREAGAKGVRNAVCDALIVWALPEGDPLLLAALDRALPTVTVDMPGKAGAASVTVDDRGGAAAVAAHLVELGHRRFGVITWPLHEDDREGFASLERQAGTDYSGARERLLGYASAVGAAGIAWTDVPVYECRINQIDAGHRAARALLDREPRPTAVLCTSDLLAMAAIDVAQERGLTVPVDLSVAGYDDIPEAAKVNPPLTTVRQPLQGKGRLAARLLLEGWAGEPPTIVLPTEAIVRQSTGIVAPL